jgi:uncharacterized protein YjbJ (UPF0337 family)
MNWDQIEGKWKQYAGRAKEKWGKLTDDDLAVIRGRRDQLIGKIQERYGIVMEAAEKEVNEFARSLHSDESTKETPRAHEEEKATASVKASKRGAGRS